jgi:hypothetical protein
MTALDILVPPARRVTVGGREIDIEPLRMRHLPAFARAVAAPWPLIVAGEYLAVVVEHAESAYAAIGIASQTDRAFLEDLRPDEFLSLAAAVFEVNMDFFARAVLPAAAALGQGLTKTMTSASSPDSSLPGTATRTSLN